MSDSTSISIIFNINDVKKNVQNVLDRLSNLKPTFAMMANFIRKKILDHFKAQAGFTTGWQKLEDTTIAARKKGRGGGSAKILINTGTLMQSVQSGSNGIYEVDNKHVTVGTTINYAKYHQQPNNTGPTNSYSGKKIIPKRDFMYLKAPDIDRLKDMLERYIVDGK